MEIVLYPDPFLRKVTPPVENFDPALAGTAREMLEFMYRSKGVGLAAPQVGLPLRLFVFNPSGDPEKKEEEGVLVNPRIVRRKGEEYGEEGCLSFPNVYGEVRRATWIRVEARDLEGHPVEKEFQDFQARVVQHELDHLEGILFVDRMEPAEKIRIRRQLEQLEREFKKTRAAGH